MLSCAEAVATAPHRGPDARATERASIAIEMEERLRCGTYIGRWDKDAKMVEWELGMHAGLAVHYLCLL